MGWKTVLFGSNISKKRLDVIKKLKKTYIVSELFIRDISLRLK